MSLVAGGSENCVCFIKLKKTGMSEYLFNMISQGNHQYNTWSIEDVTTFYCRTDVFKYSYFSQTILEWNKLDIQIRSESFLTFENSLLKIGWPTAQPTYNFRNSIGVKFLNRLRLGLSHLNKQNFHDCVNPFCLCSL